MDLACTQCKALIGDNAKFCGSCGQRVTASRDQKEKLSLQRVIAFYVAYLLYAIISFAIYSTDYSLKIEIAVETIFILMTIGFCLFDLTAIMRLYNFKEIDLKGTIFSLLFPIVTAIVVFYSVDFVNRLVFDETDNIFYLYDAYNSPLFWAFIFYVIIPPIFEELAFRGYLFNQLRAIASPQVTILATAVIFALVHFSFISFLWIFPFGIVLGYLRHKYNTLWLGMIVHFIHNLLVVALDYYYFI